MPALKCLWLIVMGTCCITAFAQEEPADPQMRNVHDPSMIYADGYYYVYSTGTTLGMRRSTNLYDWDFLGSVFSDIPAWIQNRISGVSNLWAPDITYHNGRYYLCYSASTFGSQTSLIALASNATLDPADPDYEWIDEGEIVSSPPAYGPYNYNAIDGTFVRDENGDMWLVFGSWWDGIMLTPLNNDTLKPTTSPPTIYHLARRSHSAAMEAAYITFRNGYYYLFVNWDTCCAGVDSTYKIAVGRATSITGPYYDKDGIAMLNDYGGSLFAVSSGRWIGPGHADITTVDDQDFFSCHTYDGLYDGWHTLRINHLYWDGNDWPVLGDPVVEFPPPPPQGPTVAHWNFEDGVPGAPMNDTGINGQVGTVDLSVNGFDMFAWDDDYGPSFSQTGNTPTGTGLSGRFEGGQDGYTLADSFNRWSPAAWTIELAVRLDHLNGWQTIIGRDGSSTLEAEADFYLQKNAFDNRFRINVATAGGERYILDADFVPVAGQWYYLTVVSDGSHLSMYTDHLDGSGSRLVAKMPLDPANDNALAANGYNWTFGRGWFDGNFVDHITGNLDDIRFTDHALAPTEFLHYDNALVVSPAGGGLEVSENGPAVDQFEIHLNHHSTWAALSADVTVTLTTDGQVTVQPDQLVFSASDWQTNRTITVTAVDDDILEDEPHTGTIYFALASADERYQDAPTVNMTVAIRENECGAWGYPDHDHNRDCIVNMADFIFFSTTWTVSIDKLLHFAGEWLQTTQPYAPGAVSRP